MKSKDPVAYILITGHGTKIVDKKPFCEVDLWQGLYLESFVLQQQAALIAEQEHNEMLEAELKAMREQLNANQV